MGSTGDPSGEPSPARCGPVTSSRNEEGGARAPRPRSRTSAGSAGLCHAQYRSLFRPTALLTGDADAAERGAGFLCPPYRVRKRPPTQDDALPHLRRPLAARSPLARHHHLWERSRRPPSGARTALGAPALRRGHRGPKARPRPWLCAGCQPASGEAIVHFLPGAQPRAGRRSLPGDPGHATTPPGRATSALRAVLPSDP
jgi:hypothetical protein